VASIGGETARNGTWHGTSNRRMMVRNGRRTECRQRRVLWVGLVSEINNHGQSVDVVSADVLVARRKKRPRIFCEGRSCANKRAAVRMGSQRRAHRHSGSYSFLALDEKARETTPQGRIKIQQKPAQALLHQSIPKAQKRNRLPATMVPACRRFSLLGVGRSFDKQRPRS
jgi:hypothetical protein